MRKAGSLEKTLMLEKTEGRRRRGRQRTRWLDGITTSMEMSLSKLGEMVRAGKPGVLQSMGLPRVRHEWATEQPPQRLLPWRDLKLHTNTLKINSSLNCKTQKIHQLNAWIPFSNIHSFNKCLLCNYYMPSSIPGTGDNTAKNKTARISAHMELTF